MIPRTTAHQAPLSLGICPPGKNTGVGCMPSTRGSSQPRDRTQVSCIAGDSLAAETPGKSLRVEEMYSALYLSVDRRNLQVLSDCACLLNKCIHFKPDLYHSLFITQKYSLSLSTQRFLQLYLNITHAPPYVLSWKTGTFPAYRPIMFSH